MQQNKKFQIAIALNSGFACFELIVGIVTGSLALMSDAIHNFSDSLAILIALIASWFSSRKADNSNTYGYKRAKILGAMVNAFVIFSVAIYIIIESYHKFQNPQLPEGGLIMIVAGIGFLVNAGVAFLFHNTHRDLNQKAVFVNMAMDAFASLATVVAGAIILFSGNKLIDPIVSLIIGLILIYNGWEILVEALEIILETTPKDIDQNQVRSEMLAHSCVREIVDLHIWSLSSDYRVLTAVVNVNQTCLDNLDNLVENLKLELSTQFSIDHLTIETRTQAQPHLD